MSTNQHKKQIILKPKEEGRIIGGHPWVFSNEIRETRGEPQRGDIVELLSAGGLSLGIGFYHPNSLIAFRLLSNHVEQVDTDFFLGRITKALALRTALFPTGTVYRLVYGESDFLPGLIVDRFDDLLALQTFSCGMDAWLPVVCDVLESLFHPRGIVERNEGGLRNLEGLPQQKRILRGEAGPTIIEEHGLTYSIDVLEGQKTGFFLDQRENRFLIRRFCRGAAVLDCFCNDGGFSLNATAGGAMSVLGIDSSLEAVQRARHNAERNGFSNTIFEQGDVFEKLEALHASAAKFDVVILDPPSFTKSRKNVQTAKKGYKGLHARAFNVLKEGGVLLSASCSHHILPEVFLDMIDETARKVGRPIQLLDWRGAAPDHPVLPSMPETRYLKCGVFRVN